MPTDKNYIHPLNSNLIRPKVFNTECSLKHRQCFVHISMRHYTALNETFFGCTKWHAVGLADKHTKTTLFGVYTNQITWITAEIYTCHDRSVTCAHFRRENLHFENPIFTQIACDIHCPMLPFIFIDWSMFVPLIPRQRIPQKSKLCAFCAGKLGLLCTESRWSVRRGFDIVSRVGRIN